MPSQKRSVGEQGEMLAQAYLQEKGYTIIANNWHCQFGEIDIVAEKQKTLVFVEVKTRSGTQVQQAFAAITESKREKLIASAYLYLDAFAPNANDWRIDVVAVELEKSGRLVRIEVYENAVRG